MLLKIEGEIVDTPTITEIDIWPGLTRILAASPEGRGVDPWEIVLYGAEQCVFRRTIEVNTHGHAPNTREGVG